VANGFTSPPKDIMLQIFIDHPLSFAEFESANLGYNGKHDNHYTTEKDQMYGLNSHSMQHFDAVHICQRLM
jgi:hypothetical protein